MLKKKQVISLVSIAVASFLIGIMFNLNLLTVAKDEDDEKPVWMMYVTGVNASGLPDVWGVNVTNLPIDEEGNLKVKLVDNEVWQAITELQFRLDSLNVSYLELLERVEALEDTPLPEGFVSAPAYDSGWLSINQGQRLDLTHNLNTTDLLVYVVGKGYQGISQNCYGGLSLEGIAWIGMNSTTVSVHRRRLDPFHDYVRVMIWKIQEPPT